MSNYLKKFTENMAFGTTELCKYCEFNNQSSFGKNFNTVSSTGNVQQCLTMLHSKVPSKNKSNQRQWGSEYRNILVLKCSKVVRHLNDTRIQG